MTTQVQDLAKLRSEGKLTDEEMEEDSQKLSDEIDLMREEMLGEEEQIKTDKEAKEGSLFHKSMSWCAPRACARVLAPALICGCTRVTSTASRLSYATCVRIVYLPASTMHVLWLRKVRCLLSAQVFNLAVDLFRARYSVQCICQRSTRAACR